MHDELGKGRAVPTSKDLATETSSMVHEQLARICFAMDRIDFTRRTVLDVGCGTGYTAEYIGSRAEAAAITGIDNSVACIAYANDKYPTHKWTLADATSFNLRQKFDIVLAFELIEHLVDSTSFLRSVKSHMGEGGGVFILSTPNRSTFSLGHQRSILNETHVRELSLGELRQLLDANFEDVEYYGQYHQEPMQSAYLNYVARVERLSQQRSNVVAFANRWRLPASIYKVLWRAVGLRESLHKRLMPTRTNVYKRRMQDFIFGREEADMVNAVWFIAFCRGPRWWLELC